MPDQPETEGLSEQEQAEQEIGPQINFRPSPEDKLRLWRIKRAIGQGTTEAIRLSIAQVERQLPFVFPATTRINRQQMKDTLGLSGILLAFCQVAIETMKAESISLSEQRSWSTRFLTALANPLELCDLLADYTDPDGKGVYLHHTWQNYAQYKEAVSLLQRVSVDLDSRYPPSMSKAAEEEEAEDALFAPDDEEPDVRLSYEDIVAVFQEALAYYDADVQAAMLENLRRSLRLFLPREKKTAKGVTSRAEQL